MTSTTEEAPEEPQVKPFAAFLQETAAGRTHDELSQGLHDLIEAVKDTGKAGKLQLTISVKPAAKNNRDAVNVTDMVVIKAPTGERPESFFFIDTAGNLTRENPRQPQLPLREVPRGEGAPVDIRQQEAK